MLMTDSATVSPGVRDRKKDEARNSILDAFIALLVESGDISHDAIADRTGLGRRTIYRYFPDRDVLMQAAWTRVRELAGPQVILPSSMDELLATLEPIYTGFDAIAPVAAMVRATPQGRQLRLSSNAARTQAYATATADVVRQLPKSDQKLATAMIQVLHTTPWLEMRDHWGLNGSQIARAAEWTIRALLADLSARGARPLDQPLERPPVSGAALHLIAGSTGAGKTTYAIDMARREGALRLSIDEWMTTLFGPDQPEPIQFDWMMARIDRCEAQMWALAQQAAALGQPVIIDCGLTRAAHRAKWADWAAAAGVPVVLHHLAVPAEERWRRVEHRNAERGPTFKLEVTRPMFDFVETMWEPPTGAEMTALNGVAVG
jgi:predicted kinase